MDINNMKSLIMEKIKPLFEKNNIFLNILIIILINIVGITLYFRIDLTLNNSNSLSDISEDIVSSLEEPLNIKVFFSKNLPAPYNTVDRYLRDLLEEYSESGNDNFHYEFIDVDKDKDTASDFGISTVQVREIQKDQLNFRNVYMGIAVVYGDLIEKIPSITEATGLEYQITTIIRKMTGKINALLKMDSPINVTLYASTNLPIAGAENLSDKISKIVDKCNKENYDKLKYNYVDPAADKTAMDAANRFGIVKLEWPTFQNMGNTVKAGSGLLGLVLERGDKFETIQLLSRSLFGQYMVGGLDNLQDRINSSVDSLINSNPKIGYMFGQGERVLTEDQQGAQNFKKMIEDMYELVEVDLSAGDMPEDISTLIINGPRQEFDEYHLFLIDQFIMKGKSVLFLIDSFQEFQGQGAGGMFGGGRPVVLPVTTGLEKLMSQYGASVGKNIVLDEKCYKSTQRGFGGQNIYFVPIISDEGLSDNSVISEYLKMIVWPKASSLVLDTEKLKQSGITGIPLVSSSKDSWLMTGRIDFMPFGLNPPEESKKAKFDLAVLLEGNFESYYKGKEIPEPKAGKSKEKDKAKAGKTYVKSGGIVDKAVKPGRIIIAGTSEITLPGVLDAEGKSLNSVFIHNTVDYLAGNTTIQEMRSKGLEFNPIEDAGEKTRLFLKLFNIAGLPLLVIGSGIIVWRRRSARKKNIMKEYAG